MIIAYFAFKNFTRASILDFMADVIRLPSVRRSSFFLNNWATSCNPKWRRPGNLKAKIGGNQILFCLTQKYYFHVFQRNLKLNCIFNNLMLIFVLERRFPSLNQLLCRSTCIKSNSIWTIVKHFIMSLLAREIAQALPVLLTLLR